MADIWPAPARNPLKFSNEGLRFPQCCDIELLILRLLKDRPLPSRWARHSLFVA